MSTPTTTTVELDSSAQGWLTAYRAVKARHDAVTDEMKRCREQLEAALGDAEEATVNGETVITWRWSKGSSRIDVKALREKGPDLAAQFAVTGEPTRKFCVVDA